MKDYNAGSPKEKEKSGVTTQIIRERGSTGAIIGGCGF